MSNTQPIKTLADAITMDYVERFSERPNRFPLSFTSKENVAARLKTLYNIEVHRTGHNLINGEKVDEKINDVATWIMESNRPGLMLAGTLGNGKTTMLKSIYHLFYIKTYYAKAKSLFENYKEHGSFSYDVKNAQLLIIDELGEEPAECKIYGESHEPMRDLLLYRYENRLSTIISTNLSFQNIAKRYGTRVEDRFYEMFEEINYLEPSYRRMF